MRALSDIAAIVSLLAFNLTYAKYGVAMNVAATAIIALCAVCHAVAFVRERKTGGKTDGWRSMGYLLIEGSFVCYQLYNFIK